MICQQSRQPAISSFGILHAREGTRVKTNNDSSSRNDGGSTSSISDPPIGHPHRSGLLPFRSSQSGLPQAMLRMSSTLLGGWGSIQADEWAVLILKDDSFLPFESDPRPMTSDSPYLCHHPSHPLFREMERQIECHLPKRPIGEITPLGSVFYNCIFLTP